MNIVRIWSNAHKGWWKHDSRGYTDKVNEAGLFNRSFASVVQKNTHGKDEIREIIPEHFLLSLKALSWKQPYGDLMFHGKIETRVWPTQYRGWVLICASKAPYTGEQIHNISGPVQTQRIMDTLNLKYIRSSKISMNNGCAIGLGFLHDCQHMNKEDEDKAFVEHHPELYSHFYRNVQRIKPFPFKGSQKWGNVTIDQLKKIEFI